MLRVVHMQKTLSQRPVVAGMPGVAVRTFRGPADVETWLDLRQRAFARERLGVRAWLPDDFEREMLAKPWWRPEHLWFAEAGPQGEAVGTVTLALRESAGPAPGVVNWLAVVPRWRRRGVARLLMATLEAAAWDAGHRQLLLETHRDWTAAVRFYRALGYEELPGREDAPRGRGG